MMAANGEASVKLAKNVKPRRRVLRRAAPYRSPRLTINASLPVFLFVGVLFSSVGFIVLYIFRNSEEVVIDYTYCTSVTNSSQHCTEMVGDSKSKCWCEVSFEIENEMKEPVFLFYGLIVLNRVSASQPSREEVKELDSDSRATSQEANPAGNVLPVPDPKQTRSNVTAPASLTSKPDSYSILTDTLTVFSVDQSMYVRLKQTGAAWPDMRCGRCSHHFPLRVQKIRTNSSQVESRNSSVADLGWQRFENEDFMVWMQPIASSTFDKLYRKTKYSTVFNGSLPKGSYRLLVTYTYPVTFYGGGKSLIVANSSVLGAKNRLLGVAFIATGCVCLVVSMIFCAIRLRKKIVRKKKA